MKIIYIFLFLIIISFVILSFSPIEPFKKLNRKDKYNFYKKEHEFKLKGKYPILKKEIAQEMIILLEKIINIFEENDVTYWLTTGNLLGAIRHNGLIPWDDDIDLNVPIDKIDLMKEILLKHNINFNSSNGGYKITDKKYYPFIDIIVVEKTDNKFLLCYPLDENKKPTYETSKKWPQECFDVNDVFPLKKIPFEHFTVNVPKNYNKLIKNLYGEKSLEEGVYKNFTIINNHKFGNILYLLNLTKG